MELSQPGTPPREGDEARAAIPFNRAARAGDEHRNIELAIKGGHLAADGPFTERCGEILAELLGSPVLLVHSCTAALEIAAILAEIGPGDEVIMPSYTFVSTANAFVLRGATPVFVDVRPGTLNIDPDAAAAAVGPRTKAIAPVHYAGVGCEMSSLCALAAERDLFVIEDAAQGLHAALDGRPLGTFGQLGALSFHETKNVTCGEGGALIVNDEALMERAEILREKGTDRSKFFRGQVDKYTWVDVGSSYALSELGAAFLKSQLDAAERLTARRLEIWAAYHAAFEGLEGEGRLRRPTVPESCAHNAHMYYLVMRSRDDREALIAHLRELGIHAVFHYVPLHSSPAGLRYGRTPAPLPVTDELSGRLVRLPLWADMDDADVRRVVDGVLAFAGSPGGAD
ncbi:MAG TPA: dTDP-4-amino-4,6-dideoxygalactose transaminase [Solirubrobacterales bacterium]|nr:dTDP-4-amino-4,6-dideoxygalactose transaminase [Solirubrobacterales bacterium]